MIRKAVPADLDAVAAIYDEIHQAEETGALSVGWMRGVYPVRATAEAALKRNDLFVLIKDGVLSGSGVINNIQTADYAKARWEHETPPERVCVLHTLTISPRAARMGLGRQFVAFYEAYARETGCPELRIDTNKRNLAARKLYRELGYKEIAVVPTIFNGIPDVDLVLLEKHLPPKA